MIPTKVLAAAIATGMVLSFGAGWTVHGWFSDSTMVDEIAEEIQDQQKVSKASKIDSQARSAITESTIEAINDEHAEHKKALRGVDGNCLSADFVRVYNAIVEVELPAGYSERVGCSQQSP